MYQKIASSNDYLHMLNYWDISIWMISHIIHLINPMRVHPFQKPPLTMHYQVVSSVALQEAACSCSIVSATALSSFHNYNCDCDIRTCCKTSHSKDMVIPSWALKSSRINIHVSMQKLEFSFFIHVINSNKTISCQTSCSWIDTNRGTCTDHHVRICYSILCLSLMGLHDPSCSW